jgi:hypothetical protein
LFVLESVKTKTKSKGSVIFNLDIKENIENLFYFLQIWCPISKLVSLRHLFTIAAKKLNSFKITGTYAMLSKTLDSRCFSQEMKKTFFLEAI